MTNWQMMSLSHIRPPNFQMYPRDKLSYMCVYDRSVYGEGSLIKYREIIRLLYGTISHLTPDRCVCLSYMICLQTIATPTGVLVNVWRNLISSHDECLYIKVPILTMSSHCFCRTVTWWMANHNPQENLLLFRWPVKCLLSLMYQ